MLCTLQLPIIYFDISNSKEDEIEYALTQKNIQEKMNIHRIIPTQSQSLSLDAFKLAFKNALSPNTRAAYKG